MSKVAIAKDTGAFLASTLVIQALSLVLAVFIRKALGPEAMGVWTFLGVLQSYIAYTNLGMVNAVSREIPVLRGGGAPQADIDKVRNTGFTYITAVSLLTAGALAAGAFAFRGRMPEPAFYGLLMLSVLTVIERTNNYLVQILYADKEFLLTSGYRIWSAVANAGLVVTLTWRFGLYGMYAASLLSFAFNWIYLNLTSQVRFRFHWDRTETAKLLKFGIPLFALTFCMSFFNSLDKVLVGAMLGVKALGIYSIGVMAASYVFMLPNVFQIVLLPRTLERFGDASDEKGRMAYAVLPGRLMVGYFSLFIGLFWIAAPLLCGIFLAEYLPGIPALKAALFGACFAALAQQMSHILLGYKRHLWMLPVLASMAAGVWAAGVWAVGHGGSLRDVALIMAGFQLLGYAAGFAFAFHPVLGPRRTASELLLNLAPMAFCAATLVIFDAAWPRETVSAVLLKILLYGALWALVFLALEKRMGFIGLLRDTFLAWRRQGRAAATFTTKERTCPLCGESKTEPLFTKGGFEYVRCRFCSQVYVPRVLADNVHFEDDFFDNQRVAALNENPERAGRMGRLTAEIQKRFGERKNLKILDVGCGKGWNLAFLRNAGYENARGVDVNHQALETARARGIPVDEGLLEEQKYPDGHFDVVLSDQVIEHLEEPRPVLREIARVLSPGGFFWCSVPNIDAWHIRLFLKQKHRHFAGDRHLNLSNPATFRRLLESAGFGVERIDTYSEELTLQRLKGVLLSPGDFDHAVVSARKALKYTEGAAPAKAARAVPAGKSFVLALTNPVNAVLIAGTRALKAGAYLEAVAVKDRG